MSSTFIACVASVIVCSAACSSPKSAATNDTTAVSPPPAGAVAASTAAAAGSVDGDRDFLRKLADHHKGMIAMAHLTKDSKKKLGVKPLAVRIDGEQDAEIDKIVTMLEQDFKDPYTPKISAADQALEDDLKTRSGAAYDRAFIEHTIVHHKEAIALIDAWLPTATSPKARALAQSIRASLDKEIPEFSALLAKMP